MKAYWYRMFSPRRTLGMFWWSVTFAPLLARDWKENRHPEHRSKSHPGWKNLSLARTAGRKQRPQLGRRVLLTGKQLVSLRVLYWPS